MVKRGLQKQEVLARIHTGGYISGEDRPWGLGPRPPLYIHHPVRISKDHAHHTTVRVRGGRDRCIEWGGRGGGDMVESRVALLNERLGDGQNLGSKGSRSGLLLS